MSLAIDVDRVTYVKVTGQWYEVVDRSFDTDAYEFMHGGRMTANAGTGFTFRGARYGPPIHPAEEVAVRRYCGPLSSIEAVVCEEED